jgi:peptide/nickel transport system substrate-binding protein
MFVIGWSGGGGEPNGTAPIWKTKGSQNYVGFSNADVDKLYDQAASTPGCKQEDRKKLYGQIQKIIAEEQPYVFLYTNESLLAVNKRVKVNPLKIPGVLYAPEQWYMQSTP